MKGIPTLIVACSSVALPLSLHAQSKPKSCEAAFRTQLGLCNDAEDRCLEGCPTCNLEEFPANVIPFLEEVCEALCAQTRGECYEAAITELNDCVYRRSPIRPYGLASE